MPNWCACNAKGCCRSTRSENGDVYWQYDIAIHWINEEVLRARVHSRCHFRIPYLVRCRRWLASNAVKRVRMFDWAAKHTANMWKLIDRRNELRMITSVRLRHTHYRRNAVTVDQ